MQKYGDWNDNRVNQLLSFHLFLGWLNMVIMAPENLILSTLFDYLFLAIYQVEKPIKPVNQIEAKKTTCDREPPILL